MPRSFILVDIGAQAACGVMTIFLTPFKTQFLIGSTVIASSAAPETDKEKEEVKTLKDVSSLAGLEYLETLTLTSNEIKDISGLTGMKSLKTLDAGKNKIETLGKLAENMPKLETLTLTDNEISDISAIEGLKKLSNVDFSENEKISDIGVFAKMDPSVLKTINISITVDDKAEQVNTNIKDFTPLKKYGSATVKGVPSDFTYDKTSSGDSSNTSKDESKDESGDKSEEPTSETSSEAGSEEATSEVVSEATSEVASEEVVSTESAAA
jgi:hypothetical protein